LAVWNLYFKPSPVKRASLERMAFPLPDKPSIAVLPFVNMSKDPEQEFFSDGLTEEIITTLSKSPHLFVIAHSSTYKYKNKPVEPRQVSEELGVRYVLEGASADPEKGSVSRPSSLTRSTVIISGLNDLIGKRRKSLRSKTRLLYKS
jgi:hypothetical protein